MSRLSNEIVTKALETQLFSGFSPAEAAELTDALGGAALSFAAGSVIAAAGQSASRPAPFLLLLSGQAQYVRYGLHGERCMIDYALPGSVLGIPQALGGEESYHNSMIAGTDCFVLRLTPPAQGADASRLWPRMEQNLLRMEIDKGVRLMRKIDILSGRTVREKILIYLNYESERCGSREFDIPLNRQALADYIYVDRTTLSSELGNMQRDGIIQVRRNHFVLLEKR